MQKKVILLLCMMLTFMMITPAIVHANKTGAEAVKTLPSLDEGVTEKIEKDAKNKDDNSENADLLQERLNQDESAKSEGVSDLSVWTMYARFIMTSAQKDEAKKGGKEDKNALEKAFDGAISGIIGDGGVTLDIPYKKMYSLSNELRGKKGDDKDTSGTQLASFLGTYSHYNYIDTVSGNRIASTTSNGISFVLKMIAGFIIVTSLAVYYMINSLLSLLVNGMIEINPFKILGFGDDKNIALENPIAKGIQTILYEIGLDDTFFTVITEFGLIFVVAFFGFKLMKYLSDKDFTGVWKTLQKFGIQIFTMFAMIPIIMLIYSEAAKGIKAMNEETSVNSNLASQYILDVRGWAASQNLSPAGINSKAFPSSNASKEYIDNTFSPISSRQMIADINRQTYQTLYGEGLGKKIGFDLVQNWSMNENFNVNTYFGDIQRGTLPNGDTELPAHTDFLTYYPNASYKDIEYAIWSGTQNVNDKLRDVKNPQFKPKEPIGVYEKVTFSTQSVALMLQSSFDKSGTHFYAYNLAPTGMQGNMKNLSTVKTEWKTHTMPGEGSLGIFASGLSLTAKSLGYAILGIGCIIALLTVNLFETAGRFFKSLFKAIMFGDFNQAVALLFISISFLVSSLIAMLLPSLFVNFITVLTGAINLVTQNFLPSSILEMIGGIATLYLCYKVGWGGKVGTKKISPAKAIIGIPSEMAIGFADRVDMMSGQNIGDGFKQGMRGAEYKGRQNTRELGKAAANSSQNARRRLKGGSKGVVMTGAKEAAKGFVTGGVGGAAAGGAVGAAKGGYKGMKTPETGAKLSASGLKKNIKEGHQEGQKKKQQKEMESSYTTYRSGNPSLGAKNVSLEDRKNNFSNTEYNNLKGSSNADEFKNNLSSSSNGESVAYNTPSGRTALQGTEFVDDKGSVSNQKVQAFKTEYQQAEKDGKVTDEMKQKKEQLDNSFNAGAEQLYSNHPNAGKSNQSLNSSDIKRSDKASEINQASRSNNPTTSKVNTDGNSKAATDLSKSKSTAESKNIPQNTTASKNKAVKPKTNGVPKGGALRLTPEERQALKLKYSERERFRQRRAKEQAERQARIDKRVREMRERRNRPEE